MALNQPTQKVYDITIKGEKMNKLTILFAFIVVAALSTATVLGLQNGTASENQEAVPEPPEFARDTAITYILQAHEELGAPQVPSSWEMENLMPGLLGASNLQYTADGWTVTVSYPVVLEPTYTVDVKYTGEVCFQWTGIVSQTWTVAETDFKVVQ
jgi:hypothetical protein